MKLLIFGNSGSGKSTLAKARAGARDLAHLDLDSIAWDPNDPTTRRGLDESVRVLEKFVERHPRWVIEGCYGDLIRAAARFADEMIFLNPGIEACRQNCRERPWEPHKYASKEEQDRNLRMLLDWVNQYESRNDDFSLKCHRKIFEEFEGSKREITRRPDLNLTPPQ
jgi:adenylate kinase family enzyme